MIDVMKRLAELDATNPNIVKESQQSVEECGMMPMEKPHTPATMNITANSGEELGDMLSALMQLAGVHKVGDEHMGAEPAPTAMTSEPSMRSVIDKLHGDDGDTEIVHGDSEEETEEGLVTTAGGAYLGSKAGEVIGNMIAPGVGGALGSALGGLAGGYAGSQVEGTGDETGWYVTHEKRTGDPDRVAGPFADQQQAQAWINDNVPYPEEEPYGTTEVGEGGEEADEGVGGAIAGGLAGRAIGMAVPVPGASIIGSYVGSKLGSAASDALSGDNKEKPAETVDNMPTGVDDVPPYTKDAMLDKSRHNQTQAGYPGGNRTGNANNPRAHAAMEAQLMKEYKQFIGESIEDRIGTNPTPERNPEKQNSFNTPAYIRRKSDPKSNESEGMAEGNSVDVQAVNNIISRFDQNMNEIGGYGDPDYKAAIAALQQGDVETAIEAVVDTYGNQNGGEVRGIDPYIKDLQDEFEYLVQSGVPGSESTEMESILKLAGLTK